VVAALGPEGSNAADLAELVLRDVQEEKRRIEESGPCEEEGGEGKEMEKEKEKERERERERESAKGQESYGEEGPGLQAAPSTGATVPPGASAG